MVYGFKKSSRIALGFVLVSGGFLPVFYDAPIARQSRICLACQPQLFLQTGKLAHDTALD